jgi:hypothetical protein
MPIVLGFALREALNRRRGGARGPPGRPHHPWARLGGGRGQEGSAPPHGEAALWPPPALFRSTSFVREK